VNQQQPKLSVTHTPDMKASASSAALDRALPLRFQLAEAWDDRIVWRIHSSIFVVENNLTDRLASVEGGGSTAEKTRGEAQRERVERMVPSKDLRARGSPSLSSSLSHQFPLHLSYFNMGRVFGSSCGTCALTIVLTVGAILFCLGMILGIIGSAIYPGEKRWQTVRTSHASFSQIPHPTTRTVSFET